MDTDFDLIYMSRFSHFQIVTDEISSNGQYPIGCMANLSPIQ